MYGLKRRPRDTVTLFAKINNSRSSGYFINFKMVLRCAIVFSVFTVIYCESKRKFFSSIKGLSKSLLIHSNTSPCTIQGKSLSAILHGTNYR